MHIPTVQSAVVVSGGEDAESDGDGDDDNDEDGDEGAWEGEESQEHSEKVAQDGNVLVRLRHVYGQDPGLYEEFSR